MGTTPVVHYFAKEWVLMGHGVHVFHTESSFPIPFYLFGRLFKRVLDARLGHLIPTHIPEEYDETKDGVNITHLSLKKIMPHGRFSKKQIRRTLNIISSYIEKDGLPDCFVGHWDNPQLELLQLLKVKYNRPSCLVFHCNHFGHLINRYGRDTDVLLNVVDLVGFRNIPAQVSYESLFGRPAHSFVVPSGVSKPFIIAGEEFEKGISDVRKFIYVGSLVRRKNPVTVVESLSQSFGRDYFEITYVGEGDEQRRIQKRFKELGCNGVLTVTGRIPREDVIPYLKQSDVFVMVSRDEVFGVVYLEAMALGCITIAARNGGIFGIIEDGVNGFLCEAGNSNELADIIARIRKMDYVELKAMSRKAKETAAAFSDANVANRYMKHLEDMIKTEEILNNE